MISRAPRVVAVIMIAILAAMPGLLLAQSVEQLQREIDDHNAQIQKLNDEIAQYQKQLTATSAKKQTLQNTLNQLNLNIKKTTAQISVLQNKISATELRIKQLSGNITTAQNSIDVNKAGLAQSMRAINRQETEPIIMQLLSDGTLTDVWNDVTESATLQEAIGDHVEKLAKAKVSYTNAKTETEAKQAELLKQQKALKQEQGSLNAQKKAQNELLTQTKSQESTYQKIIAQKKAQEAQFEAALLDLKAQYQRVLNPSEIPTAGKGMLAWPLDSVRVTQYFGNTAFAMSGAYNGKGHNGIDLAASIGTPVHAALAGSVQATGNTDTGGCYSFGKWVFIKHANGLSTMYAHLSTIDVAPGQSVATGQLIGYSGETGYATGPHLHFGVYVSTATEIIKLGQATKSTTPCSNVTMPVPTSLSAYLNPINYLPAQ